MELFLELVLTITLPSISPNRRPEFNPCKMSLIEMKAIFMVYNSARSFFGRDRPLPSFSQAFPHLARVSAQLLSGSITARATPRAKRYTEVPKESCSARGLWARVLVKTHPEHPCSSQRFLESCGLKTKTKRSAGLTRRVDRVGSKTSRLILQNQVLCLWTATRAKPLPAPGL